MYGEYFYEYAVEFQYVKLLRVLGKTPMEFLETLDTMHLALARVYPPMKPPLFRCIKLPNGDLTLFYYSKRPGLLPIAIGLIRRAIQGLFDLNVDITTVSKNPEKGSYELLIQNLTRFGTSPTTGPTSFTMADHPLLPKKQVIGPTTFSHLCPFYMLLDCKLKVLQCGIALYRNVPRLMEKDVTLDSMARIARPYISLTFDSIYDHLNTTFLIEINYGKGKYFRLHGQMLHLSEAGLMLFVGSPYVTNFDDLSTKGFHLADLAIYDAKRGFLLASEEFDEERVLFKKLEYLTTTLQETAKLTAVEKARTDQLIYDILPRPVASALRMGELVHPQRFGSVTILFTGIVNFDKFSLAKGSSGSGIEIVEVLNGVYKQLDKLLQPSLNPEVYKIETIQDNYLVISGAPEPTLYHAKRTARLALQMVEGVQSVKMSGQSVKLTIGINSGEVVAGVIGQRMPRYCLFGDAVNLASRTMKTGKHGRINVAQPTYKLLQSGYNFDRNFSFSYYGEVIMKNVQKPVKVWLLDRSGESFEKNISKFCELI